MRRIHDALARLSATDLAVITPGSIGQMASALTAGAGLLTIRAILAMVRV
jgi:hypothetical protein